MDEPIELRARSAQDLLACVPILLVFVPVESVVLMGVAAGPAPHARVDIGPRDALPSMCASLVAPASLHRVRRVVLFVYTELATAAPVADALLGAFTEAGVEVVDVIASDGAAWTPMLPVDRDGSVRSFDPFTHPFVTEAVVAGRVVLGSRAALARSLEPSPARVAETARILPRTGVPPARWVRDTVTALAAGGLAPDPGQRARLVLAVARGDLRDEAWAWVPRSAARSHVDVWLAVLRATPRGLVAAPAAVLAYLAWRAGDGALAWCAVDVSRDAGSCSLADLVAELLEQAVSPDSWPVLTALDSPPGEDQHAGGAA